MRVEDGKLVIDKEGSVKKFVDQVEHITFSGKTAVKFGQDVCYITERCVFKLVPEGLELVEIAPGVDLQKDILDQMDFTPVVKGEVKLMDARIFRPELMQLKADPTWSL